MSSPKVQTNAVELPEQDEEIGCNQCYACVTGGSSPCQTVKETSTFPTDERIKECVVLTVSKTPFPCFSPTTLDSIRSQAEVDLGVNLYHKIDLIKSTIGDVWGLPQGV